MTEVVHDIPALRARQDAWRQAGQRIGLVPTMGALHAGHIALVRAARAATDRVIVTVFVNPTQFGPGEDLDAYPRTLDADVALLRAEGADVVFAPTVQTMYPPGFATRVHVDGLTDVLCGAARPGHFDGVAQVVTKLLNLGAADEAFFGEKDWQQLAIIRRLAADLNFRTRIVGVPTVRAEDGLALSSRNAYLSAEERQIAPRLFRELTRVADAVARGVPAARASEAAREALLAAGFRAVDYVEVRDADDLSPVETTPAAGRPARVFGAAHLGRARLIDNVPVPAPARGGDGAGDA